MFGFIKYPPPHPKWNVVIANGPVKVVIVLTKRSDATVSMIVQMEAMNMIVVGLLKQLLCNK